MNNQHTEDGKLVYVKRVCGSDHAVLIYSDKGFALCGAPDMQTAFALAIQNDCVPMRVH